MPPIFVFFGDGTFRYYKHTLTRHHQYKTLRTRQWILRMFISSRGNKG